jgi:hypothetical protein
MLDKSKPAGNFCTQAYVTFHRNFKFYGSNFIPNSHLATFRLHLNPNRAGLRIQFLTHALSPYNTSPFLFHDVKFSKTYGLSVLCCKQKTWPNVEPSQDVAKLVNYNHHCVSLAVWTVNRPGGGGDFCTLISQQWTAARRKCTTPVTAEWPLLSESRRNTS